MSASTLVSFLGSLRILGGGLVRGVPLAPERRRVVHPVALALRQRRPPRLDLRAVVGHPEQMVAGRLVGVLRPRPLGHPVGEGAVVGRPDRLVGASPAHRLGAADGEAVRDEAPVLPMRAPLDAVVRLGGQSLLAGLTLSLRVHA